MVMGRAAELSPGPVSGEVVSVDPAGLVTRVGVAGCGCG
jgi:hypothetical protein